MVEFGVRSGVPADLPAVAEIYRTASLSNEGDAPMLLAHPETLVFAVDSLEQGLTRVATTADDHIVGFATLIRTPDAVELEDIFVAPAWMRHGVGRLLMRDAVSISQEQAVRRIEVTANPHAFAFYESVGFVHDGQVQTALGVGSRMHLTVGVDTVS